MAITINLGDHSRFNTLQELFEYWADECYTRTLIRYASDPDVKVVSEFGTFQGKSAAALLTTKIEKLYSFDLTHRQRIMGKEN